jgi:hypothetical protein
MAKLNLNAIATRALLDNHFRADILNGHRKERISEFDLTEDERKVVLSIEADTLDQFIHHLGRWIYAIEIT